MWASDFNKIEREKTIKNMKLIKTSKPNKEVQTKVEWGRNKKQ